MTDVRKCDGPGCDLSALLDSDERQMFEPDPDGFITVERNKGQDKTVHFCTWPCLKKWTEEKVKPQTVRTPT